MNNHARGFTLVELLVAVAIFAVIAALAYGGLESVIRQSEHNTDAMSQLRRMQQALTIVARDFSQLQPRTIRDPLGGSPLAAFASTPQNLPQTEFTRGGWMNPLADVRSTEERVAYQLDDGKLVRLAWPELDRTVETQPVKQTLLPDVTAFDLRFMNSDGQWQDQWPPLNTDASAYLVQRPRAVEIRMTVKNLGQITRIIEVATQ